MAGKSTIIRKEISWKAGTASLNAYLDIPPNPRGIVIFAHGSGSGRKSPRNQYVAKMLVDQSFATLLSDLLTLEEEKVDAETRALRFNIPFLAERLQSATDWVTTQAELKNLPVGYFGASTGAAAALVAAAERGDQIKAVVSRGGRPDLAGSSLPYVKSPTLFIVGGNDFGIIELNQQAFALLNCPKQIEFVQNATHLFEEPGTLEEVARIAELWFDRHL